MSDIYSKFVSMSVTADLYHRSRHVSVCAIYIVLLLCSHKPCFADLLYRYRRIGRRYSKLTFAPLSRGQASCVVVCLQTHKS